MDEEIKSSLDALERRVSATEKRFDGVKCSTSAALRSYLAP
jgi:hypothetical protein